MSKDAIRDLFASNIERTIEEVIKVDQTDEQIIHDELNEYVVTNSIRDHYNGILERYSETPNKPHDGVGIWVSGFFGSGKSSFAKYLGLAIQNRDIKGTGAAALLAKRAKNKKTTVLLTNIAEHIPTEAVIFDVSTDRGIRSGNQGITEIMYRLLMQHLGYSKDLDLAELEITLEAEGHLGAFKAKFAEVFAKDWDERKGLVAVAVQQASRVMHELEPETYTTVESWRESALRRADITPGTLATRALELMDRRHPGKSLLFVVDEVGQFVARDVQKMLDLQAVVQSLGRVGRGRLWLAVTSQEKLTELVGGIDDKRVELARLMDRFQTQVHLEPSDISEVTSKRVLSKNAAAEASLRKLFDDNRARLTDNTRLTADIRLPELSAESFIDLYPLLPYQIDLIIQVVSGLRTQGGASKHVGGANRTIIKLAQQLLIHPDVNLAAGPVGDLVRVDQVYDLVTGNVASEIRGKIAEIPSKVAHPLAQSVAKVICLLQYVQSIHRTPENIAAALHDSVTGDSRLAEVKAALAHLEKALMVRRGDDGYRIPTPAEDDWERTRASITPTPGHTNRLYQESIEFLWNPPPQHNLLGVKIFRAGLTINGRALSNYDIQVCLHLVQVGDGYERETEQARKNSQAEKFNIHWVAAIDEEVDRAQVELHRTKEMLDKKERNAKTKDETHLVSEEKRRRERHQSDLRSLLKRALLGGAIFFRGNDRSPSGSESDVATAAATVLSQALPQVFNRFEEAAARIDKKALDALLTSENLKGLPAVFSELNLVKEESGKVVFNLAAGPLHEVSQVINNQVLYGETADGRYLESKFAKEPYGWDFDAIRLFVICLLRAGKLEATSKGATIDSATSLEARNTFPHNNPFRAASFRPKIGMDYINLVEAAEHFKEVAGREVPEIQEALIASEIKEEFRHHEDDLTETMVALEQQNLPGGGVLRTAADQLKNIRSGRDDNAITTFNANYKSIKEAVKRGAELKGALTPTAMHDLKRARRAINNYWPVLRDQDNLPAGLAETAVALDDLLRRETFFRDLPTIDQHAKAIEDEYAVRHTAAVEARAQAYTKALQALKGTPGWEQLEADQQRDIAQPLESRATRENTEDRLLGRASEELPDFEESDDDLQALIGLAHCVDGYQRHESGWADERLPTILNDLETATTQELLDLLFHVCRADRFIEGYLGANLRTCAAVANEIRRRVLKVKESDLFQEDMLKQPVFVPHRPLKDPRTILMLDPACGSMHFGLYSFDLLEQIYREAWEWEQREGAEALARPAEMPSLTESFTDTAAYEREIPRLIIEHNIHGVDIDPRAAQIAGLSLWLRAQKAWQIQGVKAATRPSIRRSNVVCAEPMPGDGGALATFVEQAFPVDEQPILLRFLENIVEKMKLAGEAGSLLKIEEEIRDAIQEARDAWAKQQSRSDGLFSIAEINAASRLPELELDAAVRNLTADFWDMAESRVLQALRSYADHAENGEGFTRRLFAEDAARGFAFIDICRKRYDVAVMNPPFGGGTAQAKIYQDRQYPNSKNDLYCAFVERMVNLSVNAGLIGSITSRTAFFLSSMRHWREKILLAKTSVRIFADLGFGVLDGAFVETAAFVLQHSTLGNFETNFYRMNEAADKQTALQQAVRESNPYLLRAEQLSVLPGSPFSYWISSNVRRLFQSGTNLEESGVTVAVGCATSDNERFLRLRWEVNAGNPRWVNYPKGGDFAKFHQDIYLLVDWAHDGAAIKTQVAKRYGSASRFVQNTSLYRRVGLTYPRVSVKGFGVRVLPAECIFSDVGQGVFSDQLDNWMLLGLLNSETVEFLMRSMTPSRKWEAGFLKKIPLPKLSDPNGQIIRNAGHDLHDIVLRRDYLVETTCRFQGLFFAQARSLNEWIRNSKYEAIQSAASYERGFSDLNDATLSAYGLSVQDVRVATFEEGISDFEELSDDDVGGEVSSVLFPSEFECISYLVGFAFGRWDIRFTTGEHSALEFPDPFAPLPVCPPGQLQNAQGMPALSEDVPAAYPVRIPWDGILVDDPNHPLDIERRVREVIEVIWGDSAEAIEREACEILSTVSLRDNFRRPSGFFADHLSRYSKSRRQAPIYWLLSTASGSYAFWIYYHRVNPDTVYRMLELATEKLEFEERQLGSLTQEFGPEPSASQREDLVSQEDFVTELREFKAEIERIAPLWNPNLNDGVIINSGPVWRLLNHTPWQKKVKECWDTLVAGDYDWAHLSMHLWPERVVPKCRDDRSLAIAHDLDSLLWNEHEPGKGARQRNSQKQELADLIDAAERTEAQDTLDAIRKQGRAAVSLSKLDADALNAFDTAWNAFSRRSDGEAALWADLDAGKLDGQPLARYAEPKRILPRCVEDLDLACRQGVEDYFWIQESGTWRRRRDPDDEITAAISARTKPAVKAALKSLLDAPSPAGVSKKSRARAIKVLKSPRAPKPPRAARSSSTAIDSTLVDQVKAAIASSDGGASKSDVIDATGISSGQWTSAIKTLLDVGQVTQTGERRGARYHISS